MMQLLMVIWEWLRSAYIANEMLWMRICRQGLLMAIAIVWGLIKLFSFVSQSVTNSLTSLDSGLQAFTVTDVTGYHTSNPLFDVINTWLPLDSLIAG